MYVLVKLAIANKSALRVCFSLAPKRRAVFTLCVGFNFHICCLLLRKVIESL
jgi:hypothetical protein